MPSSQLADEQKKLEIQDDDARREANEIREQITRINALIENQIKFETKRAK
ncbi:MAG: hypothetical protein ACR2QH_16715 [Geminicoccaceae bacterium]